LKVTGPQSTSRTLPKWAISQKRCKSDGHPVGSGSDIMTCVIAVKSMSLSDLQGHSIVASLFSNGIFLRHTVLSWTLRKNEETRLDAFEMKGLRRMCGFRG